MTSGDFSWLALFLAGLVTVAQGYTQPKGDGPVGNSILTPSLQELVPAGEPFNITWVPTTPHTVTLLLLHGESTNMIPLYPIVEKLPNIGHFTWTPKTDLAPEKTHYGIQLISDDNGQYQWSTQFGISNPSYSGSQSGSGSSSSASISASTSGSAVTTSSSSVSLSSFVRPTLTASTGFPMHNSSIVHPSGTISTSKTVKTTATAKHTTVTSAPVSTTSSATSTSSTSEQSTVSEAMAAMFTAAGGAVAFAAAAVLAL